jgi:hypothetical protein
VTPTTHRLVYTRHSDGGVTVCTPTMEAIRAMSCGGYWSDRPRGFLDELVRRKTCPKLQGGHPVTEQAARRFVTAMQFGGLTTAEAWDVIRQHDCERFGHDVQLMRHDELPDRWFRDAWTRARSNSGVPYIDLEAARPIQWKRIVSAVARENKRRASDLYGKAEIRLRKGEYRDAIRNAATAEELQRIWPQQLLQPR